MHDRKFIAGLEGVAVRHAGLDRRLHARRDVLHRHEHVQLEVGALDFLAGRPGVEAVGSVVLLGGRDLLQLASRHVVVGEQQAVSGNDLAGAAAAEDDDGVFQAGRVDAVYLLSGQLQAELLHILIIQPVYQ